MHPFVCDGWRGLRAKCAVPNSALTDLAAQVLLPRATRSAVPGLPEDRSPSPLRHSSRNGYRKSAGGPQKNKYDPRGRPAAIGESRRALQLQEEAANIRVANLAHRSSVLQHQPRCFCAILPRKRGARPSVLGDDRAQPLCILSMHQFHSGMVSAVKLSYEREFFPHTIVRIAHRQQFALQIYIQEINFSAGDFAKADWTRFSARSSTSSSVRLLESMTTASAAATKGEFARVRSR